MKKGRARAPALEARGSARERKVVEARGSARERKAVEARGSARERAIYALVAKIPRGKVATYGQIAELVGIRAGHRVVAAAMRSCPDGLPWQRVVGRKGARRA